MIKNEIQIKCVICGNDTIKTKHRKNKCKKCYNDYHREYRKKNPNKNKEIIKKYRENNIEKYREIKRISTKKYRSNNIKKTTAHTKIYYATRTGKMQRPLNCSKCGNTGRIEAHHKNYDRPFDIVWLCYYCHRELHKHENN